MHVVKAGQNKPIYQFDADVVSSASDQQDIENLVTRVKIVSKQAGEVEHEGPGQGMKNSAQNR